MRIRTARSEATEECGHRLGGACTGGELIGLVGDLGAGKTCFVRGVAAGLGIDPVCIVSPTFSLVSEHRGRLALYHIDLYRLSGDRLDDLWLREYLFGSGVAVVEWYDRLTGNDYDEQLVVRLEFEADPNGRSLAFEARGPRHRALLARAFP